MTEYDLVLRKLQEAERKNHEFQEKISYIERELGNRKWDISVHRKELNERAWDIQVHRKELDEHKKLLGDRLWDVHRKELNERAWDIQVHRKELDENKNEIEKLIQRQDELEGEINSIKKWWVLRLWRKVSFMIKNKPTD